MEDAVKPTVLVVDDEPDAVTFVTAVMEEAGYRAVSASNGAEGLEKARAEKPDLVILDIQMPGKDGFSVFVDMKKAPELRSIPVVMLTATGERTGIRGSAAEMGEYFGLEPSAYVEKPVEPEVLREIVEKVLSTEGGEQ